jgi:putative DNA methylase
LTEQRAPETHKRIGEQLVLDFVPSHIQQPAPTLPRLDHSFPEDFANQLAAAEAYNKHLYRPNTYLHKWWARRCGTTFRLILKQLVADETRQDFYSPGGLEGQIVLDPMMGGGTTLHEAIRLGANVIGVDIDPIPVLQARATLTHIPLSRLESAFEQFFSTLRRHVAPWYETRCPDCESPAEIKFTLYGLRRHCLCGQVLFVDSYVLREEQERTVRICPTCHCVHTGEHRCHAHATPLVEKGTGRCPTCGEVYTDLTDVRFVDRYIPLVIVGECARHGQFFKSLDDADRELWQKAREQFGTLDFDCREDFAIEPGPKSKDLLRNGISHYLDLFSARQLYYLETAIRLIQAMEDHTERLVFSLLVSTSLEFNSMLCGYKGRGKRRPGAIRHTFSHHAYSFPYTAAENNPVFPHKSSGTLRKLFAGRVVRARKWSLSPVERKPSGGRRLSKVVVRGERDAGTEVETPHKLREGDHKFLLYQTDARCLPLETNSVDYVVTDPPYYDSVQYSDLAAFFRVWLRVLLPGVVDWDYETSSSAVAEQAQSSPSKYGDILGGIFSECHRVLNKEHGRLVFTFHHWAPHAWAELTIALQRAGFRLVNRYVVQSENPISVHIRDLRAIQHDCVLVLSAGDGTGAWEPPARIHTDDSYAFCHDCGTALGWLLSVSFSEDVIRQKWTELLESE